MVIAERETNGFKISAFQVENKKKCHHELSFREKEVLTLAGSGLLHKEIVNTLSDRDGKKISERTVQTHMRRIFKVLGATNELNAIMIGVKKGYLNLDDMVKEEDKELLNGIMEEDKEIFETILMNDGRNSSNKEVANSLVNGGKKIRTHTIECKAASLFSKFGSNKVHAALIYVKYRDEIKIEIEKKDLDVDRLIKDMDRDFISKLSELPYMISKKSPDEKKKMLLDFFEKARTPSSKIFNMRPEDFGK